LNLQVREGNSASMLGVGERGALFRSYHDGTAIELTPGVGIYTILPSPKVFAVWHKGGGGRGGGGGGGGAYIAQWSCNRIAIGQALQSGGE